MDPLGDASARRLDEPLQDHQLLGSGRRSRLPDGECVASCRWHGRNCRSACRNREGGGSGHGILHCRAASSRGLNGRSRAHEGDGRNPQERSHHHERCRRSSTAAASRRVRCFGRRLTLSARRRFCFCRGRSRVRQRHVGGPRLVRPRRSLARGLRRTGLTSDLSPRLRLGRPEGPGARALVEFEIGRRQFGPAARAHRGGPELPIRPPEREAVVSHENDGVPIVGSGDFLRPAAEPTAGAPLEGEPRAHGGCGP